MQTLKYDKLLFVILNKKTDKYVRCKCQFFLNLMNYLLGGLILSGSPANGSSFDIAVESVGVEIIS